MLQVDWAPGKGVRDTEFQRSFDKRQGLAYISFQRLSNVDLDELSVGGLVDEKSLPAHMQSTSKICNLFVSCQFLIFVLLL